MSRVHQFVHEAIDWDNVMVFLFPYFWDTPGNHEGKLFLEHKDPLHWEFLRAGAARVVLAIRHGFEEEVASLLDHGTAGFFAERPSFQEVPEVRIGTWFDYTPTGALDIEVTVTSVEDD